jgi:multidrug efflux system membrane fusion protein
LSRALLLPALLAALVACNGGSEVVARSPSDVEPAAEPGVLRLDLAAQERIALRCEPAAVSTRSATIAAFGALADPLDVARLSSEAEVAAIESAATRDESRRLATLHDEGGNVSLRAVQERQAQLAAEEGHQRLADAALQRATGAAFATRPAAERQAVVDAMLRGEVGLAHVRAAGAPPAQAPVGATVTLVERPGEALGVDALLLSLAPEQAATPVWLVWVRAAGTPLRAGAAVEARLELAGGPREGVLIPRSAVVRDGDAAWIFVRIAEEAFERRRLALDAPLDGGWFATSAARPGEALVVQGAELLLSEQLRDSIEGD